MSNIESPAETEGVEASLEREVSLSHYPGRDPVTVRTTRLPGEESAREERIRSGLHRLAQEGKITIPS